MSPIKVVGQKGFIFLATLLLLLLSFSSVYSLSNVVVKAGVYFKSSTTIMTFSAEQTFDKILVTGTQFIFYTQNEPSYFTNLPYVWDSVNRRIIVNATEPKTVIVDYSSSPIGNYFKVDEVANCYLYSIPTITTSTNYIALQLMLNSPNTYATAVIKVNTTSLGQPDDVKIGTVKYAVGNGWTYSNGIVTINTPMTFPIPVVIEYGTQPTTSSGGSSFTLPMTNIVLSSTFQYSRKVLMNDTIFLESDFRAQNPYPAPVYAATVIIKGFGYTYIVLNGTRLKFDANFLNNETKVYVFGLKPNEQFDILAYMPLTVSGNPYSATFVFLGYALTYGQLFAFAIALIIAFASLKVSRNGIVALALFVGAYATLCVLYFKVDPTFMAIPANPNAPIQAINSTITSTTTKVAPVQNDIIIFAGLIGALIVYLKFFRKERRRSK
jgi:hypothetical protein